MVMKVEICNFSGLKIHPGHGIRYVRSDNKIYTFIDSKCKRSFLMKRNARKIRWTQMWRRLHKKGQTETTTKKKGRKAQKFQRAIVGASLEVIKAKRNQKPEQRAAARDAALREIKERNKAKQLQKKAEKTKSDTKSTPKTAGKGAAKATKTATAPAKSSKGGKGR